MNTRNLSILITLLSVLLFVLSGCEEESEKSGPKGSISGSISVEADTLSGFQIGIFDTPSIDSDLLSVLEEYPQIGFPLTLQNTFDHRLHICLKSTETDQNGNFVVSGVANGTYIVVALHPRYGFAYRYNVVVNSDQGNSIGDPIQLYPVTRLSGVVASTTFETGHHYVIGLNEDGSEGNDVSLSLGTFEPGAVIRILPGFNLEIYGMTVNTVNTNNPYWFTTNDMCDSFDGDGINDPDFFNHVGIYGNNVLTLPLEGGRVTLATDGLYCQYYTLETANFLFDRCLRGFVLETSSASDIQFTNCIIMNCTMWSEIEEHNIGQGIRVNSDTNIDTRIGISKCVFFNNQECTRLQFTYGDVSDNYFLKNYMGFRGVESTHLVHHNCFNLNNHGISFSAADDTVRYNNFYEDEMNIELNRYYVQQSYNYCRPLIEYNNFFSENNIAISGLGRNQVPDAWGLAGEGILHDFNCPNNYFETSDVEGSIIDVADHTSLNWDITCEPTSYWEIDGAGIR